MNQITIILDMNGDQPWSITLYDDQGLVSADHFTDLDAVAKGYAQIIERKIKELGSDHG